MSELLTVYAEHDVPILIFFLGLLTFLTRIGGYVFLARFENIPRSVNAGLEAVPAAVITTLVVPPAVNAGHAEQIALAIAAIACFRLSPIMVIIVGLGVLVGLRQAGL